MLIERTDLFFFQPVKQVDKQVAMNKLGKSFEQKDCENSVEQ